MKELGPRNFNLETLFHVRVFCKENKQLLNKQVLDITCESSARKFLQLVASRTVHEGKLVYG